MTWSYSRIKAYSECPYKWFLHYLLREEEAPRFYATYGQFMHELLEGFYTGKLTRNDMMLKFLLNFNEKVQGPRPLASTVEKYIAAGVDYIKSFEPITTNARVLDVEAEWDYEINGIPFTGVIDLVAEDDNGIFIVDHKSRDLKPRSKRKKPTINDETLDEMLKQLYLYAEPVRQKYGKLPYKLCFNCFKAKTFIEEPFKQEAFDAAIDWAVKNIREIEEAEDFYPQLEYFSCKNLCGLSQECCYFEMQRM